MDHGKLPYFGPASRPCEDQLPFRFLVCLIQKMGLNLSLNCTVLISSPVSSLRNGALLVNRSVAALTVRSSSLCPTSNPPADAVAPSSAKIWEVTRPREESGQFFISASAERWSFTGLRFWCHPALPGHLLWGLALFAQDLDLCSLKAARFLVFD